METGICVKVMGKVNDLICFPAFSRALHVLQKRGEKGSDLIGNALTLWMKYSVSSTKALCRKPLLSYSYEYDKASALLAAIPINPSQVASCPHHCLDICYQYPATFVLLPSPAPIVYGQDGLVVHEKFHQGAGIKSRSSRSKPLNTNFPVKIHFWFRF